MITFEQIAKANETIRTTPIKGKDYAEVNQRIKAFRMVYPNGSITTDITSLQDGVVLMKAIVTNEEGKVIGTGYAQEKEKSSFINKTSFIENCETSAVGRALGMCGFGIDVSVASAEEVQNAIANQEGQEKKNPQPKKEQNKPNIKEIILAKIEEANNIGIELTDEKVNKYISDHNNGKTVLNEMNEEEMNNYLKVLDFLVKGKLAKNASNSEQGEKK